MNKYIKDLADTGFLEHFEIIENGKKKVIARIADVNADYTNDYPKFFITFYNLIDINNKKTILKFKTAKINRQTWERGFKEDDWVKFDCKFWIFERKEDELNDGNFKRWNDRQVLVKNITNIKLISEEEVYRDFKYATLKKQKD